MKRLASLLCVWLATPLWAQSGDTVLLDVFRTQLELEKRLISAELSQLEKGQEDLRLACDRMLRLADDLLRTQRDGEDSATLTSRSGDLRRAEAEVAALIAGSQQLRATIVARRAVIEQLTAEVKRLEETLQTTGDDLSGRWQVAIEPGGLKGTFDLRLFGTLVSGVYELAGGWKGSLRGTLVGNTVRLERIDSQLGFVAVYTGRLEVRGGERRIEGTWQATNLAAGLPSAGTWLAQREAKK
ncbi:hypothetical protein EG19_01970 [Thermoanaerobaculum aquaticum]|uniref:DUF3450 family protein n=2 Tax=Thermoanaerobaculum aquaticum TaxID=1312852 RepID=A0A062XT43_9BACT|nr:hypothetical protein [Thermoanaerobaculum aquaticum]KDA53988.1 hypothetical protein EG19_01970 [Thermoanaerobaculum aquaticum]